MADRADLEVNIAEADSCHPVTCTEYDEPFDMDGYQLIIQQRVSLSMAIVADYGRYYKLW